MQAPDRKIKYGAATTVVVYIVSFLLVHYLLHRQLHPDRGRATPPELFRLRSAGLSHTTRSMRSLVWTRRRKPDRLPVRNNIWSITRG